MVEDHSAAAPADRSRLEKTRLYGRIGILTGSAVIICAAVITYFNAADSGSLLANVGSAVDLALVTLLPYMISAVVAASTAIAVLAILPALRSVDPAERVLDRIKELGAGNLATRLNVASEGRLKDIVAELNHAVGNLGHHISTLKIVNRQQWGTLCCIRDAARQNDSQAVLRYVEEMEKNWRKIAEIEQQLTT